MAKIDLIQVKGNSYFCTGVLSIGLYVYDKKAILIDTGGDESCAKNIDAALELNNLTVSAIINTHRHPDHVGGNAYFQKKYPSIQIYATYDEQRFIEDPTLAPRCFCGLAEPFAGLINKYIAPQKASVVTHVLQAAQDFSLQIDNKIIQIITVPGHTPGSIGILTPDTVLYSGDALFGESIMQKHPVLFYTNIDATLASFKKLALLSVNKTVLYHGGLCDNLASLVKKHQENIIALKELIADFIQHEALSIDQVTQKVMLHNTIPNTLISYTLTQTTVRAYLAALEAEKRIIVAVTNGLLTIMKA